MIKFLKCFILVLCSFNTFSQGLIQLKDLQYTASACQDEDHLSRHNKRITNYILNGDSLIVKISIVANCDGVDKGDAWLKEDTLLLYYYPKMTLVDSNEKRIIQSFHTAECDCCFELTYSLNGINKIPKIVLVNKMVIRPSEHRYILVEPKFLLLNGDTVNYIDKYGFEQGKHIGFNENGDTLWNLNYRNGDLVTGLYIRKYFDNGAIKSDLIFQSNETYLEKTYNDSGEILKECIFKELYHPNPICQEF